MPAGFPLQQVIRIIKMNSVVAGLLSAICVYNYSFSILFELFPRITSDGSRSAQPSHNTGKDKFISYPALLSVQQIGGSGCVFRLCRIVEEITEN